MMETMDSCLRKLMRCCSILLLIFSWATADKPQMFRRLHKSGFHRELHTSIKWTVKPTSSEELENCGMLLVDSLPSGAYVDPFQLNNMLQFGGPKVLVDKPVDIELPEHFSPKLTLHVFTDLIVVRQSRQEAILSGSVTVPIHLRYHKPSEDPDVSYVDVTIENPRFYTNCTFKESAGVLQAPCDHRNSSQCLWLKFDFHAHNKNVRCSVPVGNQAQLQLVVMVTLMFTCGGCLFLIYVIFRNRKETKLKGS